MAPFKVFTFLLLLCLLAGCSSSDDQQGLTEACNTPTGLVVQVTSTESAVFSWSQSGANLFRIEYGEAGFNIGSGTQTTTTELSYTINGLNAETTYQVYIQADCGQFQSQRNGPVAFETPPCPEVTGIEVRTDLVPGTQARVKWDEVLGEDYYELEYGPIGFILGDGARETTNQNEYTLRDLTPETDYEVYVRSVCGNNNSLFSGPVAFTTQALCPAPFNLLEESIGTNVIAVQWERGVIYQSWFEVEYGPFGYEPGTGISELTDNQFMSFNGLEPGTTYDFYVRMDCGANGFSLREGPLTLTTDP